MKALIGPSLTTPRAFTMSDKSINPDSVRSLYNPPELHETPEKSADNTDQAPRLHSGSRDDTKSVSFLKQAEFHGSFQAKLLYALDSRSAKKIFDVLEDAVMDQNYESLVSLAEQLDESPLIGDQKFLFDEAINMRRGGIGNTLLETAGFIAGGHDRDRYLTASGEITALKIKDVCHRLGAKER